MAASPLVSADIAMNLPSGVESCQGRRFLAFISTLDSSPRHFIIELGTKSNAVQLIFVPSLMGLGFLSCDEGMQSRPIQSS